MRCRKVRSYLSAYCNGEVTGRKRLVIDKHISDCSCCRKEEAIYYSLNSVKTEIGSFNVSDKFNEKLLNRVAQERFAETRTKAYTPSNPPILTWGRVLPSVITACVAVFVTVMVMSPNVVQNNQNYASNTSNTDKQLDDSYKTVMPKNNPNMAVNMNKNWSLNNQMERAERVQNLSNTMTQVGSFSSAENAVLTGSRTKQNSPIPFFESYYNVRPVIKVYIITNNNKVKEDLGDY